MLENQAYAFAVSMRDAYCVVEARGELDVAAVPDMRASVRTARRCAPRVVLDLRDVTFMDTFALRALFALQLETPADGSFHAVPGEAMQRLLDLSGGRAALRWISPEQLAC